MANKTRVRVELRAGRNSGDKERAFRSLHSAFKRKVTEAGIISDWKSHQFFESKGEKRRRKAKESAQERQKQKLRDHFGNKNKKR